MKLTKSLAELDAAADELLAKSKAAEKLKKADEDDDEVTPEEVSEDATVTPDTEDAEDADTEKDEEQEEQEEQEEPEEDKEQDEEDEEEPVKKSEDTEPEEDEEPDEDEEPEDNPDNLEKSLKSDFESDDVIRNGVEQSEFYAAIVDIFAKSLGDMQYDVQHQSRAQAAATDILAKSLKAVINTNRTLQSDNNKLTKKLNRLEKSMSSGFESMSQELERVMSSLEEISSQPVGMRKSLASISVRDRDFDQSINGQKTIGGIETLSKSQVLDILNTELYSGNQNVTPQDIISYESGAPLKPHLQSLVASKCK